jgi:hypothetical protein
MPVKEREPSWLLVQEESASARTEDRRQKTEDRRQKTEDRSIVGALWKKQAFMEFFGRKTMNGSHKIHHLAKLRMERTMDRQASVSCLLSSVS